MAFLIGVIIFIGFIIFSYYFVKKKIHDYFGGSLKDIIKEARLEDEEIPKFLSSMDSVYLEQIRKDFPDININELKRMSEKVIIDSFLAIDSKDSSNISCEKVKSFVDKKIREDGKDIILHDNFKIHNTVISKYSRNKGIATIYFASSFEYIYCRGEVRKKVQDRARCEFIHVIDATIVPVKQKTLGISCLNCGSPLVTLGDKKCSYCGSLVLDVIKRTWVCNDLNLY